MNRSPIVSRGFHGWLARWWMAVLVVAILAAAGIAVGAVEAGKGLNRGVPTGMGYTVHLVGQDGRFLGMPIQVPLHDLRREQRGRVDLVPEYLLSVGNAIETWGRINGKSEAWIRTNRESLHIEQGLLLDLTAECSTPIMSPDGVAVSPECGGRGPGGPVSGGTCGSIVCSTMIKFHGQVIGCGGGCGDCSIVTVCG